MSDNNNKPAEVSLDHVPPEVLSSILSQMQAAQQSVQPPAQRNLEIKELGIIMQVLNEREFYALQHELQSVVYKWMHKKGLLI